MKTSWITVSILAGALALSARGQSAAPSVTAAPSPAPSITGAPAPAATSAPNQIVYAQRLPSAEELSTAAAAQGLTIERIEQTSAQTLAIFKSSTGQLTTVSYQLIPPAGTPAAPQATAPANPPATVVYQRAPRVVYYDDYYDPFYYPRYWYPPVSLSFGYRHIHRGGGWSGGHGGGRGRR